MRKILSFLSMAATLLAIVFFGVPSIADNPNLGFEFSGGYEIVYEITDENGNSSTQTSKDAAEVIASRINYMGINDPDLRIEGENDEFVRVAVNTNDLIDLTTFIEMDATITFTDQSGNVKMDGSVLAEENGITFSYTQGQAVVLLNIADTETFSSVTEELAGQNMMAWIDYNDGAEDGRSDYFYYNNSSQYPEEAQRAAKKLILNVAIDAAVSDSTVPYVGDFEQEEANQFQQLMNAGTLNFEMERSNTVHVSGSFGENAFNRIVIAGLVGLILIIALMIIFYKIPGVISSITLLVYSVAILFVFNLLSIEFSIGTIAALVVGIGLAMDACCIVFERIKEELYKGRSVKSAYEEGCKKSTSAILDTNITLLLASMVLYFFGRQLVRNFAITLLISILSVLIIMFLIVRLMLKLFVKSGSLDTRKSLFGVKEKSIPDITKGETQTYFGKTANFNYMKQVKKAFISVGSIIGVGAIFMLIFGLTTGKVFNFGTDFVESGNVTITIKNYDRFEGLTKLENEDGEITVESVEDYFQTMYGEFGTPDKVHVETYTENSSRTEIECIDIKVEYKDYFRQLENVEEDLVLDLDLDSTVNYEDYVLIASYQSSPLTAQTTILNTLLSVGIAIVVMAIYLMIRFRYTYSITLILAMISNLLITFALFAIFRIEMTVSFVIAALTFVLFTANYSIVLFDRIRELCKETNHGKINQNDRFEIVNRSLASTFNRTAIVTLSMFMPLLVLVIIGTSATFNFSIALILGLVASVVTNTFIAPRLWLFLERKHVIRIKEKSVKRGKERKQSNELEELTIPGIND